MERYPEYFQGFVQLEQEALSVSSYSTQLIHGLLQTEAYTRTLLRCDFPPLEEEEIEQLTQARLERKALFDRKPGCVINVILEDEALRRRIGDKDIMRNQYAHLTECSERPNIVLQVMPSQLGAHAGLRGPMTVIETPEQTSLVYTEALGKSLLVSKPDEVGVLARRYAMIRSQALRPEETALLIRQLAGDL